MFRIMFHPSVGHLRVAVPFRLLLLLFVLVLAVACAAPPPAVTGTTPRVFFLDLKDGTAVSSPLAVKMGAENFIVEPAGEIVAGHGHLHILVDADCVPPGQGIPKDETHLHYGQGQMEAELTLAPGKHSLCLQAADGTHVALAGKGMTQTISVDVQ